jgi:hypothetical protein
VEPDGVLHCWGIFVLSQQQTLTVDGRAVLLGDHPMTAKDARRMPGVVTLHQDSDTQSKPHSFRGHYCGAIGLLLGTFAHSFCLPLSLRLHQGFKPLRQGETSQAPKSLATRLVQMARDFAREHHQPSLLVLDAFCSVAPVFQLTASVGSVALKKLLGTIGVRAKKSSGAYVPAPRPEAPGPGRPCKYGDKVKLYEVFDHLHLFDTTRGQGDGALEDVSYLGADLLWKPTGELIRFVFALTRRGPLVWMGSDLAMHPVMAIALYGVRVRGEPHGQRLVPRCISTSLQVSENNSPALTPVLNASTTIGYSSRFRLTRQATSKRSRSSSERKRTRP